MATELAAIRHLAGKFGMIAASGVQKCRYVFLSLGAVGACIFAASLAAL
jgi:hypothetical protein